MDDNFDADFLNDVIDLTNICSITDSTRIREARAIIPECGRGRPASKVTDFKIPKEYEHLIPSKLKNANFTKPLTPGRTKGRGRITLYQQEHQQCLNFGIKQQCEMFLGKSHHNDAMAELERYRSKVECDDQLFPIRLRNACEEETFSRLEMPAVTKSINPLAPVFVPRNVSNVVVTDVLPKSDVVPDQFSNSSHDNSYFVNGHDVFEELVSLKKSPPNIPLNSSAPVFTPTNLLNCDNDSRLSVAITKPMQVDGQFEHDYFSDNDDTDFCDRNQPAGKNCSASVNSTLANTEWHPSHKNYPMYSIPQTTPFPNTSIETRAMSKTTNSYHNITAKPSEVYSHIGNSSGSDESSSTLVRSSDNAPKSDSDTLTGHCSSHDEDKDLLQGSITTNNIHAKNPILSKPTSPMGNASYSYNGGARPKKFNKNFNQKPAPVVSSILPVKSMYCTWKDNDNHLVDAFGRPCFGPPVTWSMEEDFPTLTSQQATNQKNSPIIDSMPKPARVSTALELPIQKGGAADKPKSKTTDGHFLLIENLPSNTSFEFLRSMLQSFGTINEIFMKETLRGNSAFVNVAEEQPCDWIIKCLNEDVQQDLDFVLKATKVSCPEVVQMQFSGCRKF